MMRGFKYAAQTLTFFGVNGLFLKDVFLPNEPKGKNTKVSESQKKSLNSVLSTNVHCSTGNHWSDQIFCEQFRSTYLKYREEKLHSQDWRYPKYLRPNDCSELEKKFDKKYVEKQTEQKPFVR